MSLQELVQRYLQQIASLGPAASTVRNYHYVFSHFLEVLGDQMAHDQVQSAHLGVYLKSLNARRFAPTTRVEHLRKVRAFFHWAQKEGHLSHNPSQLFRLPCVRIEGWVPAPEQVVQLLEAPPRHAPGTPRPAGAGIALWNRPAPLRDGGSQFGGRGQ